MEFDVQSLQQLKLENEELLFTMRADHKGEMQHKESEL
jgi:hypothetical protein